ncbi:unnamed protein product [Symbiodinium natans]|uniref:Uncharacterized protein n=1 Tax=Symbiodinium natans TaxID=878477 RepID=A0A812L1F8_9DINO|nr:unnamed protein product [Symbiodinium natans]
MQRLPMNFYIRQWYEPMEDLAWRAMRCAPGPGTRRALEVLEALDRALCFAKMEPCFEDGARRLRAAEHVCAKMDATGVLACDSMQDLKRVPRDVFAELERSIAGCAEKDQPLWTLLRQKRGVLWSLGAALNQKPCDEEGGDQDLATHLLCLGFAGILLEGHPERLARLKDFFGHREDLVLLSQPAEPRFVGAMLEDATWNNRVLRDKEVDLLQITLGVSDCSFLSALLEGGVRPRFLRIIYWHVIPPPLLYQPGSYRPLGDWYEDGALDT